MPFLGRQPTSVPLTSSDITDGIISTAKIADDAVGNTKLDLTANYAFTGTVTGAGGLVKLLSATISSAVSEYDISSTYINSTYDTYLLQAHLFPATDSVNAYFRVFVGGSIQTGTIYAPEVAGRSSSNYSSSNGTEQFYFNTNAIGNATGEGIAYHLLMQNVNSTTAPFCYDGGSNVFNTSGSHNSHDLGGSLVVANVSNVVNGVRLYFNTGNIASGTVLLYGLVK